MPPPRRRPSCRWTSSLTGPSGEVFGSLKLDPDNKGFTFVQTGPPLAAGMYTVTLVGASGAIQNASTCQPLDGGGTGTPGNNYTMPFTVAAPSGPILSIPDFARGPGQPVVVPAAAALTVPGKGLPIRISNGSGITSVMVVLTYDPSLLTIAGVNLASTMPAGTQIVTNSTIPGRLSICITSPTAMSSGPQDLVELSASVPSNAPYRSKEVLGLQVVSVNGSTSMGEGDQAVDVVTYLGNTSGTGTYNSNDATLIRQVLTSPDPNAGFLRFPLVDPVIVGNVSAKGSLNSSDATILRHYLTTSDVIPQIPTYTGPPSTPPTGPDPKLFLPGTLAGLPGQSLTVPVELLQTNNAPIELQSFSLVIGYDPSTFRVSGIRSGRPGGGVPVDRAGGRGRWPDLHHGLDAPTADARAGDAGRPGPAGLHDPGVGEVRLVRDQSPGQLGDLGHLAQRGRPDPGAGADQRGRRRG